MSNNWVRQAIRKIEADNRRSADTHLLKLNFPGCPEIDIYFKDESTHPTGSLKHRLARSLFLYGLCNGWIKEGTPVIEASSGSTAVSEAYFARLLGLPFIAVMPKTTSQEKIASIRFYGGQCHLVDDPAEIYAESRRLAEHHNGHFIDQFTYAERATDWRGNNNIAQSLFEQMQHEPHPIPYWVVMSAGTGGTSATLGRYIRYIGADSRLCVVDPEYSVFYDSYQQGDTHLTLDKGSRIEGIGRPRVEPSFVPAVIDRMEKVADADSIGAIRFLEKILNRKCGGSTGTNLIGVVRMIQLMRQEGKSGSIVSVICDGGERYLHTYYNDDWCRQQGLDWQPAYRQLEQFYHTGEWQRS